MDKIDYNETVINSNGTEIFFQAAAVLMDDDIREDLHLEGFDDNQTFFEAYCKKHLEKYGEEFELDKANPQW